VLVIQLECLPALGIALPLEVYVALAEKR